MASITITILLLIALTHTTHISLSLTDDYNNLVADHFQSLNPRSGSRFLKEVDKVKKGDYCDDKKENICRPSVEAKNGTQLLTCCKNHCRDVLSDRNNCGQCGTKCGFGQLCCNGICTVVAYDVNNCGKCANVCKSGVRCEYGNCGYA